MEQPVVSRRQVICCRERARRPPAATGTGRPRGAQSSSSRFSEPSKAGAGNTSETDMSQAAVTGKAVQVGAVDALGGLSGRLLAALQGQKRCQAGEGNKEGIKGDEPTFQERQQGTGGFSGDNTRTAMQSLGRHNLELTSEYAGFRNRSTPPQGRSSATRSGSARSY